MSGASHANPWNEHQKILKLCSEFLISATVLIPIVNKQTIVVKLTV